VCFYIPRQWRSKGIADQLLDAAVEYCKARGAAEVEAFSMELKDPARREAATAIYTGVATQFVKVGFAALPRAGKERAI
jgi:GNAT superfamily N-acetyltransferase